MTNNVLKLKNIVLNKKMGVSSYYLANGSQKCHFIRGKDIGDYNNLAENIDAESMLITDTIKNSTLHTNDILIQNTGHLKAVVIPESADGYMFSANLLGITIDTTQVLPEFIVSFINSKYCADYFNLYSTGQNKIKRLNKDMLLEIELRIPSIEIQKKCIYYDTKMHKLEIEYNESHEKLETAKNKLFKENVASPTQR